MNDFVGTGTTGLSSLIDSSQVEVSQIAVRMRVVPAA